MTLKKSSTCSSKFLNNFIEKALLQNNGSNTIYSTISYRSNLTIRVFCKKYFEILGGPWQDLLNVGRWVALLNSVLRIGIAVKCNCNCNYILFTKLPWPGDSKGTFRSSSQAATCPPVYHTRWRLHTVPFNAECQAGKL